jgi:hypothetical protein
MKARDPAEIFGKNSGLLLRRFGHLLEQRGLGRVMLSARDRTRKIGSRSPPASAPGSLPLSATSPEFTQIRFTLPVARS